MQKQKFGLELEFTGITRRRAANLVAEVLGGTTHYKGGVYKEFHIHTPDGRKWKIVYDSSIKKQASTSGRWTGEECELVSPICYYDDIEPIQETIRRLRKGGARINDSCGIHIHLDGGEFNATSLRNISNMMHSKQDMLYRACQVRNAHSGYHYSQKLKPNYIERLNKEKPKSINELHSIWYSENRDDDRSTTSHYHKSRYNGLNLHNLWYRGTVEFRIFNSTLHAGEVKAYIQLALAMGHKAKNAKRMSPKQTASKNEKFTFRTWLLSLDLIGEEFKTCRHHLMKNLEGNAAWRYTDDNNQPDRERYPTLTQAAQEELERHATENEATA